jgi:eukaryotic-like serine/threonine-protein kinase
MSNESEAALVGTIIADRYRIVSRIGEGGMGQVYLAEHIKMKRMSAIKVMRPTLVDDAEALQRFTREAENASKLSHPNVASIFDFGETSDGIVYLAMEFIEGESLHATLVREQALHPQVAADVIAQAADALQAAHDLGILHRDLKPDNLMLTTRADGTFLVKLVDFGIARTMDSGATRVTKTGLAVGTPEYMSPEQLSGDELDARSDQYALALVAFASLTGQEAFADATGKQSLILRLTSRPRRLVDVRPDIDWPLALQQVFDQALAPDAADRFDHIADFADALSEAVNGMSASQTAEIYSRALQGRASHVSRRTPGAEQLAAARGGERTKVAPAAAAPARDIKSVQIGRRRSGNRFLPTVLLIGGSLYGAYWYGAQKPDGTAREISDTIGSTAKMIATPVMAFFARPNVPSPLESAPVKPAAPTPRRKRADSTAREAATRDTAVTDSVVKPRDTAVVVTPPPDTAR